MAASEIGHLDIVQLLVDRGANPLLKNEVCSVCCVKLEGVFV